MSANKHLPHVMVLPEDDAARQLAEGFKLELSQLVSRQLHVLPEVGGWPNVLRSFANDYAGDMDRYPERFMVLLIDFDTKGDARLNEARLNEARRVIPDRLRERVFVLGPRDEPEDLTQAGLGTLETIGRKLAKDCRDSTDTTWGHPELRHNTEELERLRTRVCPFLFGQL
jgi:hypothetical protein